MKRSYDTIAFFYDRLSRLVYGKTLVNAQAYLLESIPANAHLLIVGGGTGTILEEITAINPSGLSITFIDASEQMIKLAKQKNTGSNKVTFIAARIETLPDSEVYDLVITPFLFDNFKQLQAEQIFEQLHTSLRPQGLWLYCDFLHTKVVWQRVVLGVMYLFFRVACGITASGLPDMNSCFSTYNYKRVERQYFLRNFVVAEVYQKE